jgi:hypothetical protein
MILIRVYKVIEDSSVKAKILEKYEENSPLPFDLNDKRDMYDYLKKKYGQLSSHEGVPLAYEIYKWGGDVKVSGFHSFFPGYDEKGDKLPIHIYGRIDTNYEEYTNEEEDE